MLRLLAIGTLLASRVPIQVDAKHISGGNLGGIWGSTWPLGAGSLVLGALIYQHEPDPEGHRRPTMKQNAFGNRPKNCDGRSRTIGKRGSSEGKYDGGRRHIRLSLIKKKVFPRAHELFSKRC